jgi:hypothetical protein
MACAPTFAYSQKVASGYAQRTRQTHGNKIVRQKLRQQHCHKSQCKTQTGQVFFPRHSKAERYYTEHHRNNEHDLMDGMTLQHNKLR